MYMVMESVILAGYIHEDLNDLSPLIDQYSGGGPSHKICVIKPMVPGLDMCTAQMLHNKMSYRQVQDVAYSTAEVQQVLRLFWAPNARSGSIPRPKHGFGGISFRAIRPRHT